MVVLKCVAQAGVILNPYPNDNIGRYLKAYDPEAFDGRGSAEWTPDLSEAMKFDTGMEALNLWKAVPKNRPVREDGKPNRPLTAWTVEVVDIDG